MRDEHTDPLQSLSHSAEAAAEARAPLAPLLLSESDAAKLLGISARSVFSLCASGQLPTVRINRRKLIDRRDVEALIARTKISDVGLAKNLRWRNNPPSQT